MLRIRAKLLSVLIWIVFLAGIGLYTTYYTGELASGTYKIVSLKSAANDLTAAISSINNILTFYSISELSATAATTTTTTTDLKNKREALKVEYEFAVNQLNGPIEILKSDESFSDRAMEISAASGKFLTEAEAILALIDRRLEAEKSLVDIMANVRENRHQISDVAKAGSGGSEKLKLDTADASYKEKEYNFQYQDKKHADEWMMSIRDMAAGLKKEGFNNLLPFADSYLEFAQKAIDKRTEIQDMRFNEKYHLDIIKSNIINTDISISKITDALDEDLNKITSQSATQKIIFFSIISLSFVISGIFIFWVARGIIVSIGELTKTAQKISVGDLTQRAAVKTEDEIGFLGSVFNQMIDNIEHSRNEISESNEKLEKSYKDIEKANASLEEKVRSRTKELEEIKNTLEVRVHEKTAELQDRLEELEKFKKLVVGRELKMVELKEEIEVLKKDLENKK